MQITSRTLTPAENMMRLLFPQAYAARVAQELYGLEGMFGEPPQIVSEEGPPAPGQQMTQLGVYESGTGMFKGVSDPGRIEQLQNLKLLARQAARIAPFAPQVAENVLGGVSKGLQVALQPAQTGKPVDIYSNLQIDPITGRAWGLNKLTQRFEPIPTVAGFNKPYVVQGATPEGVPTTELVIPRLLSDGEDIPARITVGEKKPMLTPEEVKQEAQRYIGMQQLDELERLVTGPDAVDLSPLNTFAIEARAGVGPLGRVGAALFPGELTEKQARVISIVESLSNQMLAAMRGANVGPEEQAKFERQLPRLGQDPKLFRENIRRTRENLKILSERIRKMRGRGGNQSDKDQNDVLSAPPPPPGFILVN